MDTNMQGIQPSSLTVEELMRYMWLQGAAMPKDWQDAMLTRMADEFNRPGEELDAHGQLSLPFDK